MYIMSTPGTYRRDSLRRPASLPEIGARNILHESLFAPARCGSDPTNPPKVPLRTSEDKAVDASKPSADASPRHIPPQDPNADDFGPTYDYLKKVEELADGIRPGLYHDLFGKHCLTDVKFDAHGVVMSGQHPKPVDLDHLRLGVQPASKQDPCIIIVEGLNASIIQMLGETLNVDSGFFVRHLERFDPARDALSNIRRLGDQYRTFIDSRWNTKQSSPTAVDPAATDAPKTLYMQGEKKGCKRDVRSIEYLQSIWSQPGTHRITRHFIWYRMHPRISCALVAEHSCKAAGTLHRVSKHVF